MDKTTKIVNCKVAYIRPEYSDLKEWSEDPSNIYIARGGIVFVKNEEGKKERYPKRDSIFANPFKVKKKNNGGGDNRIEVLDLYEKYIIKKIEDEELYNDLIFLKGKSLGCWCKERDKEVKCHGDILIKLLERYQVTGKLRE